MQMRWLYPVVVAVAVPALAGADSPALTIYNRDFAVVRERIPLDLKAGTNAVSFAGATVHLEPDSVVLRDPAGRVKLRILEQSFRADTISQPLLLHLNEGKEIEFHRPRLEGGGTEVVRGTIVRSGYVPNTAALSRFGSQFAQRQQAYANWQGGSGAPIVRVGGKLQFSLPGEPIFPELGSDAILYPTLSWQVASDRASRLDAELSYVTGGMRWEAAYNLVAPEKGDLLDIVGWVTLDNQSGKTFENAAIKLLAGDVSKIRLQQPEGYAVGAMMESVSVARPVTEKAFDEYHLYTLPRPATLRNREMKQVEFLRGERVAARTLYVYNGAAIDWRRYAAWSPENVRNDRDYGTRSNPKVWVMREIANTAENGLGMPLPAGRTRFYRHDDDDGRLEFTGENTIDHTPRGETLRIYTGDAFDVVGERRRTDYKLDNNQSLMEEAFEIRLRNRKKERVEVRVAERLYRWVNWEIVTKSDPFTKTEAQNVEFVVAVEPDQEKVVSYRVRYDWK